MRERLRKGKAEQERRALQAECRAEEVWSSSSSKMRRAERAPREALYKADMLKWRIEGSVLAQGVHARCWVGGARGKPFQNTGLGHCRPSFFPYSPKCVEGRFSEGGDIRLLL